MKAVILAGGFGTRLKERVSDVPKPMASIAGKPFLEHQLNFLREQGVREIILTVHHMADKIKSYFGNGLRCAVDITYSEEETPLGTAGAIKKASKFLDDTFLVLNGDSYSKINLERFLEFHKSKLSKASMSLTSLEDIAHYGSVELDGSKIKGFSEKSAEKRGLINTGIYIFEPVILDSIEPEKNVSLEKEIFPRLAKEGKLYGYVYEGYFMDIGRPETYDKFRKDVIKSTFLGLENTVRSAMQQISKSGVNLVLVTDENEKLLGALNDRIIRTYLVKGGNLDDKIESAMAKDLLTAKASDDENKITESLLSGTNHLPILDDDGKVIDVRFSVEDVKSNVYPVVSGKSPLRISFAGGGTDLSYFFEKHGGAVISATIDKYCYATMAKRADSRIVINSDLGEEIILDSKKLEYDGRANLIKAVVKVMKPDFGFDIYAHNDIPPGRGLGSSASLAVLVAKLISNLQGTNYDDYKLAEIAYKAEREELKIGGGWQDQYATATGGFNFIELGGNRKVIYPLRLKDEVINDLNNHLLLCYVGKDHQSKEQHESQSSSFKKDEEKAVQNLIELKKIALDIKDSLLTNNIDRIGLLLQESWDMKKRVDEKISHPRIDELYEVGIRSGAYGGKLLGAGGGGYLLFFYNNKRRNQLKECLQENGGEIMDFNFEFGGTKVWPVRGKF